MMRRHTFIVIIVILFIFISLKTPYTYAFKGEVVKTSYQNSSVDYIYSMTPNIFPYKENNKVVHIKIYNGESQTRKFRIEPISYPSGWKIDDGEWDGNNYKEADVSAYSYYTFTFYVTVNSFTYGKIKWKLSKYVSGWWVWENWEEVDEKEFSVDAYCNINVNVHNIEGLKLPSAGGTITVDLKTNDGTKDIDEKSSTFKGGEKYITIVFTQVKASELVSDKYRIEVFQKPNIGLQYKELWGVSYDNQINNESNYLDFYRYMPYIIGINLPSKTYIGEKTKIDIEVKNPSNLDLYDTVRVRLIIDKDKKSPYDYDKLSAFKSIKRGDTETFTFYFTPSSSGTYYLYYMSLIGDICTDQNPWYPPNLNVSPPKGTLSVNMANHDDDDITVNIFIDGATNPWKSVTIPHGQTMSLSMKADQGYHIVAIKWRDPDTNIKYHKELREYVRSGQKTEYQFTIDKHLSSIRIYVRNVNGNLIKNAVVIRYNANWQYIDRRTTDSSGCAYWNTVSDGKYYFEVYYNNEFWGDFELEVGNKGPISKPFIRYMPHIYDIKLSYNEVPYGGRINITIYFRNPTNSKQQVKIKIIIDKDKVSPWDREAELPPSYISSGGTGNSIYIWSPPDTGKYYVYVYLYTKINNNWVLTDQWPWSREFTVKYLTLKIYAKDRNNNPIPHSLIILYRIDNNVWSKYRYAITDSNGLVTFTGLKYGKYVAEVRIYHNYPDPSNDIGLCIGGTGEFTLDRDTVKNIIASDYPAKLTIKVYYNDGKTLLKGYNVKLYFPSDASNDPAYTILEKSDNNNDGIVIFNNLPKKWWCLSQYKNAEYTVEIYYKSKLVRQTTFTLDSFDVKKDVKTSLYPIIVIANVDKQEYDVSKPVTFIINITNIGYNDQYISLSLKVLNINTSSEWDEGCSLNSYKLGSGKSKMLNYSYIPHQNKWDPGKYIVTILVLDPTNNYRLLASVNVSFDVKEHVEIIFNPPYKFSYGSANETKGIIKNHMSFSVAYPNGDMSVITYSVAYLYGGAVDMAYAGLMSNKSFMVPYTGVYTITWNERLSGEAEIYRYDSKIGMSSARSDLWIIIMLYDETDNKIILNKSISLVSLVNPRYGVLLDELKEIGLYGALKELPSYLTTQIQQSSTLKLADKVALDSGLKSVIYFYYIYQAYNFLNSILNPMKNNITGIYQFKYPVNLDAGKKYIWATFVFSSTSAVSTGACTTGALAKLSMSIINVKLVPRQPDISPPQTTIIGSLPNVIHNNSVTIAWSGTDDMTNSKDLLYQYMLVGYGNNWSDWTLNTHVTYNNLKDGEYTFKVRAKDKYNNIDPTPAETSFIISKKGRMIVIPNNTDYWNFNITGGEESTKSFYILAEYRNLSNIKILIEGPNWITVTPMRVGSISADNSKEITINFAPPNINGEFEYRLIIRCDNGEPNEIIKNGTIYVYPHKVHIIFSVQGLSQDISGVLLTVDGRDYYYNDFPVSFNWSIGSTHSFEWNTPLSSSENGKRYVWSYTSGLSSSRSGSITVSSEGSITAYYKVQYALYISIESGSGSTNPSPGSYWYDSEVNIQVSASPSDGYVFDHWLLDGSSYINNPISIVMDAYHNLKAYFNISSFSITFSVNGLSNDVSGVVLTVDGIDYSYADLPKSFTWNLGSTHTYEWHTPIPSLNSSKRYVWASSAGLSTSKSGNITVSSSGGSVIAYYNVQYKLYVNVKPNNLPLPEINPGSPDSFYPANSNVTLTAKKIVNYTVIYWMIDGSRVNEGRTLSLYMDKPHHVTIVYKSVYIHNGELVVKENSTMYIHDTYFIQNNGDIHVEYNGTLIIKNAVLYFNQTHDYNWSIVIGSTTWVNDKLYYYGHLIMENVTIISNYDFNIVIYGTANLSYVNTYHIDRDNIPYGKPYIRLSIGHANAPGKYGNIGETPPTKVLINNSQIEIVFTGGGWDLNEHNVELIAKDSVFRALEFYGYSKGRIMNCTLYHGLEVLEHSNVSISLSHIYEVFLGIKPSNVSLHIVNCTIDDYISIAPKTEANISIISSSLNRIWDESGKTRVLLISSNVSETILKGNSSMDTYNSTLSGANLYNESKIYVSRRLDIHTMDTQGENLSLVNITIRYSNNTLVSSKFTDKDGNTGFYLTEKIINATGEYYLGDYIVSARYLSYLWSRTVKITNDTEITMILPVNYTITIGADNIEKYNVQVYINGTSVGNVNVSKSLTLSFASNTVVNITVDKAIIIGNNTRLYCSNNSLYVTITHNLTIQFNYTKQFYLTVKVNPEDSGSASPRSNWFNADAQVNISVSPNLGYEFDHWEGFGLGSYTGRNNSVYITINNPIVESAYFKSTINDTVPPNTIAVVSGVKGNDDWYVSNVSIHLNATDDLSRVAMIKYSFDNATWHIYTSSVNIDEEGYVSLYYKSIDKAGNMERTNVKILEIDKSIPVILIKYPLNNSTVSGKIIWVNGTVVESNRDDLKPSINDTRFTLAYWSSSGDFAFKNNTPITGVVTVSIDFTDLAGNTGVNSVSFSVVSSKTLAKVGVSSYEIPPNTWRLIPIWVNTSNLGAYDIKIEFDNNVINITSVIGGDPPFNTPIWNVNSSGYVKVDQFISSTEGVSGNITIAYLNVTAVGRPGSKTGLKISVISLVDATSGSEITPRTSINGKVIITPIKVDVKFTIGVDDKGYVAINISLDAKYSLAGGLRGYKLILNSSYGLITPGILGGEPPFNNMPIYNRSSNGGMMILSFISEKHGPQMRNLCITRLRFRLNSSVGKKVFLKPISLTIVDASSGIEYNTSVSGNILKFMRGDVNGDDRISIADAMFIAQYLAGNRPASNLNLLNAASVKHDQNGDKISIADAMFIAQYLAGLRDSNLNLTS